MLKALFSVKFRLVTLICCICFALLQGELHAAEGAYYEIIGGKSAGYLVGSMHAGVESLYPLDQRFENLMGKVDILALEAPVELSKEWQDAILSSLKMKDEEDFLSHVSTTTFDKARSIIVDSRVLNQTAIEALSRIHPYITYQFLGNAISRKVGKINLPGMELHFSSLAKKYNVKVIELEDPFNLTNSIKSLSKDEMDTLMTTQFTLFESDEIQSENNKKIDEIGSLVKNGKYASVNALNESYMKTRFHWTQSMFNKVYYSRNQGIANNIIKLLKNGNSFLALVGASHLSGEAGIINLLRQSGYLVEAR